MDYGKIDAALASALDGADARARLPVFIEAAPLTLAQEDRLADPGARAAGAGLFSAELEPRRVEELSEWSGVRRLRLSQHRRLAGPGPRSW